MASLRQQARQIYGLFTNDETVPLKLRKGLVADVNENGTLNVQIATSTGDPGLITNMHRLASYTNPQPGDGIWYYRMGRGRFLAIGPQV